MVLRCRDSLLGKRKFGDSPCNIARKVLKTSSKVSVSMKSDIPEEEGNSPSLLSCRIRELVQVPIVESQIVQNIENLVENQNYLVLFTDGIDFQEPYLAGNPVVEAGPKK